MTILNYLHYLCNQIGCVESLIYKWTPSNCTTEAGYINLLYKHLDQSLDKVNVVKEYGLGRARIDIVVGKRVAVELKRDLNTTAEYQRLRGQLIDYFDNWNEIILVLLGNNDEYFIKELRKIEKESQDECLPNVDFRIVIK